MRSSTGYAVDVPFSSVSKVTPIYIRTYKTEHYEIMPEPPQQGHKIVTRGKGKNIKRHAFFSRCVNPTKINSELMYV